MTETSNKFFFSPFAPIDTSRLALRPIANDGISIGDGLWRSRLETNREVSLLTAAEELERAGNFRNFRIAAGREEGSYTGHSAIGVPYLFLDSDVYKWLEALSWEIGRRPSPKLERLADETITLLADVQEADGYLNSYFQITTPGRRFHTLVTGHELYNAGHLIQAGVAHLRATGAVSLTDICERYAECIRREFVDNGNTGLPAHPGIETALVELYRATGNRQHLDLAMLFIDRRGEGRLGTGRFGSYYYQDHLPIRDAEAVTGHAVMALYLGAGLVDAYVETGDAELLAAAQRQWQDMVATKTYITGGVGSRYRDESIGDPYELPPDLAYCETCASVASVMLSWRLLMVTGEGKYADLIERTLYNGVLPGVSLDGTRFFYANPLHVRATHMDSFDKIGATERQPWFYCACCPPNVMRIFSSLEHIIASESDNCVQVHQYVACTIASAFAGVTLDVRTELPWSGRSEVTITRTPAMVWELSLRIPAWAAKGALGTLNGEQVDVEPDASGYLRIARAWTRGDVVALSFPVEARWVVPVHRLDAVRGCVAIERGPLVYCFEHADQPSEVDIDDTAVATGEIAEHPWRDDLGGIVALKVTGFRLPKPAGEWPYADLANPAVERPRGEIGLTAIPYYVWAHRGRGGMRIWIPAAERGSE